MKNIKYLFLLLLINSCSTIKFKNNSKGLDSVDYYANILKYRVENDEKLKSQAENVKYGYNSKGDIIEYYDNEGMWLKYESNDGVLKRELFFENYNEDRTKRLPSSIWNYTFKDGLKHRVDFKTLVDSTWLPSGFWSYEYKLDKKQRVIEVRTYDKNQNLKFLSQSTYYDISNKNSKNFSYSITGKLIKHNVKTNVLKRNGNQLIDSTTYEYDKFDRVSTKVIYNDNQVAYPKRETYKYNKEGKILQQTYFLNNDELYFTREYVYDKKGRIKIIKRYDENGILTYVEEYEY